MAENCIDQAWMICHYLNKSDRPIAIKNLEKLSIITNYKKTAYSVVSNNVI